MIGEFDMGNKASRSFSCRNKSSANVVNADRGNLRGEQSLKGKSCSIRFHKSALVDVVSFPERTLKNIRDDGNIITVTNVSWFESLFPELLCVVISFLSPTDISCLCTSSTVFRLNANVLFLENGFTSFLLSRHESNEVVSGTNILTQSTTNLDPEMARLATEGVDYAPDIESQLSRFDHLVNIKLPLALINHIHTTQISFSCCLTYSHVEMMGQNDNANDVNILEEHKETNLCWVYVKDSSNRTIASSAILMPDSAHAQTSHKINIEFRPQPNMQYFVSCRCPSSFINTRKLLRFQLNKVTFEEIQAKSIIYGTTYSNLYKMIQKNAAKRRNSSIKWGHFSTLITDSETPLDIRRQAMQYPCDKRGFTLLHLYCERRNNGSIPPSSLLQTMIEVGGLPSIKSICKNGLTPLHSASRTNNISVIPGLLQAGGMPLVMAQDFKGKTALHYASIYGHIIGIKLLVKAGGLPSVIARDSSGSTPLHYCSRYGHLESLRFLIWMGGNNAVMIRDKDHFTLLHLACRGCHLPSMKVLIEEGGMELLLARDFYQGTTALHHASRYGRLNEAKLLIEAGGKQIIFAEDNVGSTSLHYASRYGHIDIVTELIQAGGANIIKCLDEVGRTPLHLASYNGHTQTMKLLIEVGGLDLVSWKDNDGRTPLHCASYNGHVKAIEFIIKLGVAVRDLKDNAGWTPSDFARMHDNGDSVQLLQDFEIDRNIQNKVRCEGRTAPY